MMEGLLYGDSFTAMLTLAGLFLLLFVTAELLYRFGKVRAEITRKIVHIGTGLLTLFFPLVLKEIRQAGLLCGGFFIILLLSIRYGWLPSIHAISRRSYGSLLYPVAVFGVFSFNLLMNRQLARTALPGSETAAVDFFFTPILILAICDPAAAFAGKRWARRFGSRGGKTWAGSAAFFLLALCIATAMTYSCDQRLGMQPNPLCDQRYGVLLHFSMALVTTLAERVSGSGWDNLTIPAAAVGVYLLGYAIV